MPVTTAALWTEISADPKALGYAGQSDGGVESLINAKTGPGAAPLDIPGMLVTRNAFAYVFAPAALQLETWTRTEPTNATYLKYADWYAMLKGSAATNVAISGAIAALLQEMVGDGLITQAALTALTTVLGSRAEVLGQPGDYIDHLQVAAARQYGATL
jgi:hypothetical protein